MRHIILVLSFLCLTLADASCLFAQPSSALEGINEHIDNLSARPWADENFREATSALRAELEAIDKSIPPHIIPDVQRNIEQSLQAVVTQVDSYSYDGFKAAFAAQQFLIVVRRSKRMSQLEKWPDPDERKATIARVELLLSRFKDHLDSDTAGNIPKEHQALLLLQLEVLVGNLFSDPISKPFFYQLTDEDLAECLRMFKATSGAIGDYFREISQKKPSVNEDVVKRFIVSSGYEYQMAISEYLKGVTAEVISFPETFTKLSPNLEEIYSSIEQAQDSLLEKEHAAAEKDRAEYKANLMDNSDLADAVRQSEEDFLRNRNPRRVGQKVPDRSKDRKKAAPVPEDSSSFKLLLYFNGLILLVLIVVVFIKKRRS